MQIFSHFITIFLAYMRKKLYFCGAKVCEKNELTL